MKKIYLLFLFLILSNNLFAASTQKIKILEKPLKIDNYINAVAYYEIYAVVLRKEKYLFDTNSRFSKYDLALGWDKMMLEENYKKINIKQRNRWYFWDVKNTGGTITLNEISQMSSNHHIVVKDSILLKKLDDIDKYDYIKAKGYLINIKEPSGFSWYSSTTNLDFGDGACELFYITELEVNPK